MNRIRQFVLIVAGLLVLGVTSYAQTAVVETTLAAAVTDPAATTLRVASATGFTAGSTAIYVDRELMTVRAVNGTAISVVRGARGTRGVTHASGAAVFVGPVGSNSPFITYDNAGSCIAANETLPQFNITNGKEFDCTSSLWSESGGTVTGTGTENKISKFTAAETLGDSQITDTGSLITLPGTVSLTGAVTFSGTNPVITLKRTNNTEAAGAISFNGSDDSTDWQVGTNQTVGGGLEINRGATPLLYVDTTGFLGIGDSTPTEGMLTVLADVNAATYETRTNCLDSAGAAACGSAAAGHVVIDAAATTVVVSTTAVTADSQIQLTRDDSLNTRLSITCNTQSTLVLGSPRVSARSAGTSFTITIDLGPTTNPMCIGYELKN